MTITDITTAAKDVFNDLPLEQAKPLVAAWPGHSAISFAGPLTYAAYNDVPVTYFLCEDDNIIPSFAQRSIIENMKKSGAQVEVVSVNCSHCPNESQPEKVIEVIRKAAGEVV